MFTPDLQSTRHVLMIRPVRFVANLQTASSNHFQVIDADSDPSAVQRAAADEFDGLVTALRTAGVNVHVVDDTLQPHTPDSIFPNNWVSFHADGSVVLYPMLAENRRAERRRDLIELLTRSHGFHITRTVDITHLEATGKFLEGTGSMVLDRVHRIAYACLSPRTDPDVLKEFARQLDYDVMAFHALDGTGLPIYHTNVLMAVGTRFAAVCLDCIEASRRDAMLRKLQDTGHEVIELSYPQMAAFAGNMLELRTPAGRVIAMSQTAHASLTMRQREQLAGTGPIINASIPTIEHHGGGSVRCMIAEIFLPRSVTT